MSNVVRLRNGVEFNCDEGRSILEAAKSQSIVLEHSCRNGRCGACKARIVDGTTDVLQDELFFQETEDDDQVILTCCRSATSELTLDIEDLSELGEISSATLPCRIDKLELISPDVICVTLRFPPSSKLKYLPGQYVDIIGKNGLRRSYSIANAPDQSGKISLHIRKVKYGKMSAYWFKDAKVNDLLRIEGPQGTFFLRRKSQSILIMLATGTGIAPIKAILDDLEATDPHRFEKIYLLWGGRTEPDHYWQPNFPRLPLQFIPVLSRSSSWQGQKGYVQEALLKLSLNLKTSVVYACGSINMIEGSQRILELNGLDNSNFYSDAFVVSG